MRNTLLVFCLLAALVSGLAQVKRPLALSKSMVAVRITHPEQQLVTFAPLLTMVDSLIPPAAPGKPGNPTVTSVTGLLKSMVESWQKLPGVDTQAPLWVVVMPPPADKNIPPVVTVDGVMKPNPEAAPPTLIIMTLTDSKAFKAYADAGKTNLRYAICGKYAVGKADKAPAFDSVNLDLSLVTKRDVAISLQMANINLKTAQDNAPPIMGPMLSPVFDVITEQQQNVKRAEIGLTMIGRDLSAETYTFPVPGSGLADSLGTLKPDNAAVELAGYLPENLAYCGAGSASLPGMPGAAQLMLRVGFGLLGAFMPDRSQPLNDTLSALIAQCDQGRALGVTLPDDPKASAGLVAIYRTSGEDDAKTALRNFIGEIVKTRDAVMGGMLSNVVGFALQKNAEQIDGQTVDLLKISITPPPDAAPAKDAAAPAVKKAPMPPFKLECRVAYLDEKMLVTMGADSAQQMAVLLKRVKQQTADGFTTGDSYQTLKGIMPATSRGFETIALRDLCMVVTSWMPPGQQRDQARTFLTMFPPQCPPISTYQDVQDGRIHGEVRIPGQQLDFLYAMLKMGMQMRMAPPTATGIEKSGGTAK